jgi:hypothetical protein
MPKATYSDKSTSMSSSSSRCRETLLIAPTKKVLVVTQESVIAPEGGVWWISVNQIPFACGDYESFEVPVLEFNTFQEVGKSQQVKGAADDPA